MRWLFVVLALALSLASCTSSAPAEAVSCPEAGCKEHGLCVSTAFTPCQPGSDADCRASTDCTALGLCAMDVTPTSVAKVCAAKTYADCKASTQACGVEKKCDPWKGACQNINVIGKECLAICDAMKPPAKWGCWYGEGVCGACSTEKCPELDPKP